MQPTFLDRLIAQISPRLGRDRLRARIEMEALRGYDAARTSRRTRGLRGPATSANAETETDLPKLRNSARKLIRNNPYASAAVDVLVGYQVGAGITVRSNSGDAALDKLWNDAWAAWSRRCDVAGRLDFAGLTTQAMRTRSEAGEVLGRLLPLTRGEARARDLDVPFGVQMLEPDHLDPVSLRNSTDRTQGIELDALGRPVAYWLTERHPGEPSGWGRTMLDAPRRIPAEQVVHLFRAHMARPGQVRGVPDLAPVMTRLASLDEFEDAIIEQAKIAACLVAFVHSSAPADAGPLERKDADALAAERRRTMAPGMIERLLNGEEVTMNQPPQMAGVEVLPRHTLRAIATGLGLTYDLVTGDLTGANYSSLRAGRLTVRRMIERDQWLMAVPMWCEPIARGFTRAAQMRGVLPDRAGTWPLEFGPPAFPFVDPLKDALAIKAQLRMGLLNWGQAVAEAGWDPREQASKIAEWNAEHDRLGLILDGDGRRTGGTGAAQDAAQNAAIEIAATGAASGA
jgi:lambda family phage portal protein